jgi:hypothetical protein
MTRRFAGALLAVSILAIAPPAPVASACAVIAEPRATALPSLEVERVLIAYDRATEIEHFVREITFTSARDPFGFVVPTPSRPEVEKAPGEVFRELEKRFPFAMPEGREGGVGRRGGGSGAPAVEVLDVKRVGSFTAFTLAATEAKALAGWLEQNHFEASGSSAAWLAHYVKLGFYYVAFRYEPDATETTGKLASEVVRISFSTPHPFYPYLEPDPDPREAPRVDRLLALWFVSQRPMTPIAAMKTAAGVAWVRPWKAGLRAPSATRAELAAALGPTLPLPGGSALSVQMFEDQKTSRAGFSDVIFVPEAPDAFDEGAVAKRKRLLSVLDPELEAP